jgi:predicted ATPase
LHGGNEYRVSKELDIPRSTVRYHIEKHGLRGPSRRPGRPLAPAAPPGPAARDGHMRWETRPVAALRLTLPAMPGALAAPSQPLIGIATERIEALEGQVVDVSPHGLLAIFGVSKIEDAAYRAARAGLGLLRTIERDHRPLVAGLAVHCRVSLVGRAGDRGVVSAEDLAQIRCDLAAALPFLQEGALIATDEAAAYLRRRFTLVPHRGGPAAPALAHVVIGPLRVGSEAASPAPRHLAGRNAELAQLEDLLARARSGRGQAVWVTGEAGIGKSRLLVEFLRRLDRSVADTFEGRCQPDLRTPYLAAGDIVRDVFGIAEMDGLAAAEEKVRRGLAELALDPGALAPPLLDLLGLVPLGGGARSSPEALKARASAAVRQTLLAGASRRPLVLILEDMQWADEPSADVITALVDAMGAARILLVATYRTGFAPPWVTRSLASQLKLSPLGEAASIQLVRGMAGGDRIADDVLAGVLARAEGIPLFLEEFTRAAAIDPGLLEHSVPGAIREVLTSRVDRLGATDRAIVQAASVLAADFSLEALAALLPEIDGAEVEQGLTRLEAAELVREQRAAPVPMYSFHHVLTREAVYLGLAPEVRRRLHVAMLDTMGRWPADAPERAPEVMARHLAGSDRTEEAVDAWLRAGRQARGRSANVDAISHLQKGLGLLRALPVGMEREARELQLQVAMAHALVATKGYAAVEVEVALARANELGQALGSLPQLLEVLLGGWQLRLLRSEHDDAARLAEQLLTMSEKSGQPIARALALLSQALPDYYRGHVPDATAALAGAAAITVDCADQLAALDLDQHPGVVAHGFLAVALLVGGRLDDAVEPAKRALALARGSRHALSLAAGLHLSCLINQQRGDADLVAALAAEELAVAREHVLPFWIAGGLFFSGWAMARQGKLAEAIPRMREGIDLHRGSGALLGLPAYLADLAAAHIAAGDLDQATDALDQGLRQVHTHGETSYAAELHRIRGDLLLRLGAEPEGAEGQYREGHEIACRQAQALYALRSALGLARMWHRDGRSGAARELLLSSIAPFAAQAASAPELLQARTALIDLATSVPPAR